MGKNMISIGFEDQFGAALRNAPSNVRKAIEDVIADTANKVFSRIKFRTPRDRGTAAAAWVKTVEGSKAVISNKTDYINVLEYGGYPVIPARYKRTLGGGLKRGNAYLGGGYQPKGRTVRAGSGDPKMLAQSNVSRQAPRGMVRLTLAEAEPEYVFNLEEALDKALNDLSNL